MRTKCILEGDSRTVRHTLALRGKQTAEEPGRTSIPQGDRASTSTLNRKIRQIGAWHKSKILEKQPSRKTRKHKLTFSCSNSISPTTRLAQTFLTTKYAYHYESCCKCGCNVSPKYLMHYRLTSPPDINHKNKYILMHKRNASPNLLYIIL